VQGVAGLLSAEWLLTNGLGGFAMGNAASVPTRRYHGLLIAATHPPVGRVMMLNATVDRVLVGYDETDGGRVIELSGFRFGGLGDRIHPDGPTHIESFTSGSTVKWVYVASLDRESKPGDSIRVTKTVCLHRDTNVVSIAFTVEKIGTSKSVRLSVRPLVSLRDMHGLIRRSWADRFNVNDAQARGVTIERDGVRVFMRSSAGSFVTDPQWWGDFFYSEEDARGQDCVEDLFSPGAFTIDLPAAKPKGEVVVRAAIEDFKIDGDESIETHTKTRATRWQTLEQHALKGSLAGNDLRHARWTSTLVAASDDFVVARLAKPGALGELANPVSIIAGYPWFSDWGRDTFIALPGLMLATGRFDEARRTLRAFTLHRRRGLIPNVFNEQTGEPEYNTVDGSLWFIQSACAYVEATGDRAFWLSDLAPACLDVIANYRRGTEFNIAMDPFDKLITAGTNATQLTWMDARRDGVIFTPRQGKAVEINALWISGLKRISELLREKDAVGASNLNDLADAASRSFRKSFWNDQGAPGGCCYDVLTPSDSDAGAVAWRPDATIRPNQIFAASLPHSPLSLEQQRAVVRVVRERLWTPRGVRTLDPADPRYRGRYEGNLFQRDGAYHNGTAWPWLLGPLAEAVMRAGNFSGESRAEALAIVEPILDSVVGERSDRDGGACLGQFAEIFDGDAPQRPQGCLAQAWSVGELLRVLVMIRKA